MSLLINEFCGSFFFLYDKNLYQFITKKRHYHYESDTFYKLYVNSVLYLKSENTNIWQGMRESNSQQWFWRPLLYHLTNPLTGTSKL